MLIEWLLLVVLVPAILVPLVLLGGFAGCGFEGSGCCGAEDFALVVPTEVQATATGDAVIAVGWGNPMPSTICATFEIERTTEGQAPTLLTAPGTPILDYGLDAGTTYSYRVRAVCRSDDVQKVSDWSEGVSATTFYVAFFHNLFNDDPLTTDAPGPPGGCIVQRIEASRLLRSGTQVSIIVQGSRSSDLTLRRISISAAAGSGDAYDSDPTVAPTIVDSDVMLTAEHSHQTPTITYNLDRTRPLLIVFEIGSLAALRQAEVDYTQAQMYYKLGDPEAPVVDADISDRSGYTFSVPTPGSSRSVICLVQAIFVI